LDVGALGVPLDSEDEVVGGIEFYGFDDVVLGRAGGDEEVVAGGLDGLVVAGVDVEVVGIFMERAKGSVGFVAGSEGERVTVLGVRLRIADVVEGDDGSQAGAVSDGNGVGFDDAAVGSVIDIRPYLVRQVLVEGASTPDVEDLQALADGEDGFVEVEGVLNEEFVDGGAGRVGVLAGGDGRFAVGLRVDVGGRAGEKDALAGGEDLGDALRRFMEWDGDGCGSGGVQGVEVLGEGALIIGGRVGHEERAGWFWNGNVDGHSIELLGYLTHRAWGALVPEGL
jgi:hypothetical protein